MLRLMSSTLLVILSFGFVGCESVSPDDVGWGGRHTRLCFVDTICTDRGCKNVRWCIGGIDEWSALGERDVLHRRNLAWQRDFGLSFEAQHRLDQAFLTAEQGSYEGLKTLGLSSQDVGQILISKRPTAEGTARLAANLGITIDQADKMFDFISTSLEEDAKNIKSGLWKDCLMSGRWKTPENNHCQKTYWNGCSPETGASICSLKK